MANNYIYVLEEGSKDYSRWLHLSLRPARTVVLHLSDLCHPGRLTSLGTVSCDLSTLKTAVDRGALQITLPLGYLLATRNEDVLMLEFKGLDDSAPSRVFVSALDVVSRIEALEEQAKAAA